jgi:hypothetical protein
MAGAMSHANNRANINFKLPTITDVVAVVFAIALAYVLHVQLTNGWGFEVRPCIGCGGRHQCTVISRAIPDAVLRHRFAALSNERIRKIDVAARTWLNQTSLAAATNAAAQSAKSQSTAQPDARSSVNKVCAEGNVFRADESVQTLASFAQNGLAVRAVWPALAAPPPQPLKGSISILTEGFDKNVGLALQSLAASFETALARDGDALMEAATVAETAAAPAAAAAGGANSGVMPRNDEQSTDHSSSANQAGASADSSQPIVGPGLTVLHDVVVNSEGWVVNCAQCTAAIASRCMRPRPLVAVACAPQSFKKLRHFRQVLSVAGVESTASLPINRNRGGGRVMHDDIVSDSIALVKMPIIAMMLAARLLEANQDLRLYVGGRGNDKLTRRWLVLLGVDPERLIGGETIRAQTLLVPDLPSDCGLTYPSGLRLTHQMVKQGLRATRFNKCLLDAETGYTLDNLVILVNEANSDWDTRNLLVVEQTLRDALPESYAFFTLSDAAPPSLAVIHGLFSRAVAVVGPQGYLISNAISSQAGTCIVELLPSRTRDFPDATVGSRLMYMSWALGMHYQALPTTQVPQSSKYQMHPQRIVQALLACLHPSEPHR